MNNTHRRKRAREIIGVFTRYGLHRAIKPEQMRRAFEELGPTFVKIGQILSTRPDILPDAYLAEFRKLQDNVRPEKFEDIRAVIESDLQGSLAALFPEFEERPSASASLAEVHRACLPDGRPVVVKVQRPRARETMLEDIAILKSLSRLAGFFPQAGILHVREMLEELDQTARQELDFVKEAENIRKFRALNSTVRYISCPDVYGKYSTPNILVMERVDGVGIGDTDALADAGYDLADVGRKLVRHYFKQVFEDGFFHADPHPGNLVVREGKIVYLDFGMMGTISRSMQEKLNNLLRGIALHDVDTMTQAILLIGVHGPETDTGRLYDDVERMFNQYIAASLDDINLPALLNEVFAVCRKNGISLPREMTLLGKGVLTLEGVAARVAPEINVMQLAVEYAKRRIVAGGLEKRDWSEQLENLLLLLNSGARLPLKLTEFLNGALAGRLTFRMEFRRHDEGMAQLNRMVNRLVFGLILSSLLIGSSLIIFSNAGPKLMGLSILGLAGYVGAAVVGLWLLVSILRSNRMK